MKKIHFTKSTSVTVGLAIYNEEQNISNLLTDVVSQKSKNWHIKEILVACGGCTDRTVEIIKSLAIPNLTLLINPIRKGKAFDEQKIFDRNQSDILIMLDGDVRLSNTKVFQNLITPMLRNPAILQCGGNARPYTPKTFFEKSVYITFQMLDQSRVKLQSGHNVFGASGQCIALRKSLVKKIKFPKNIIAEDDFIYFTNQVIGGEFRYVPSAIVRYHLPQHFMDYFKQTQRSDVAASIRNVESFFPRNMVQQAYHRPLGFIVKTAFTLFISNPLGFLYMFCVRVVARISLPYTSRHYDLHWYTATSTKQT